MTEIEIRDAASVVLIRDHPSDPKVLVGQRGRKAVFMPSKFVFPGGAVDDCDDTVKITGPICEISRRRLQLNSNSVDAEVLFSAAVREVWEETGIRLAVPIQPNLECSQTTGPWQSFVSTGVIPCAKGLHFFFRAITPPGRSRRFDARFFLGRTEELPISGDLDAFDAATDELSNLRWASLSEARKLDMPSISVLVLDAVEFALSNCLPPPRIPFHFQKEGMRRIEYLV